MKAIEARKLANDINEKSNKSDFYEIIDAVRDAVSMGKYHTIVDIIPSDKVVIDLRNDGYKVDTFFNQKDGNYTQILWHA